MGNTIQKRSESAQRVHSVNFQKDVTSSSLPSYYNIMTELPHPIKEEQMLNLRSKLPEKIEDSGASNDVLKPRIKVPEDDSPRFPSPPSTPRSFKG